ncbi:MAG: bifunctional oligoribonuclease/PAP phosphatase NrnA [Bacteroidota bacterium]
MENFEALRQLISRPEKVVITTHHKPDADALGSSLGLAAYLVKLGHTVNVITPSDYPRFLNWMPGEPGVIVFTDNKQKAAEIIAEAKIIFCLDFGNLQRINDLGPVVGEAKAVKVMVDHHLQPQDFADIRVWDTKAAATAELIFDIISFMGDEEKIDADIADCLYAGIMTDTGGFRHNSTTPKVFRTVARLTELGANGSRVHGLIYENNTEQRLRFLGYVLAEKLVVLPEYHVAYIAISKEEITRFHSETGDTEGFVNFALSLEGITMGAIIIDRTEAIKISFRSVGDFSVNDFARKHFEGGGHRNASGGKSNDTLEHTVQKFVSLLPAYKEALQPVPEKPVALVLPTTAI